MSMNTALSGIKGASTQLGVHSHNITNASTTGFKSSRTEFADVYSATSGTAAVGAGLMVSNVSQSFQQGNINFTTNALDMAINGGGYFQLMDNGSPVYTRAGAFSMDRDGYIINASEQRLQGYNADATGTITPVSGDLIIDTSDSPPFATTEVALKLNLDADSTPPTTGNQFVGGASPSSSTYTNQSSVTVYDSLGTAHVVTTYYIKADPSATADAGVAATPAGQDNQWYVMFYIDGEQLYDPTLVNDNNGGGAGTGPGTNAYNSERLTRLNFNSDGTFSDLEVPVGTTVGATSPVTNGLTESSTNLLQLTYEPDNGAATMVFTVDFDDADLGGITQYGSSFSVQGIDQNGYSTGRLNDLEVSTDGTISGRFSNGQTRNLGQVQLAAFANENGLAPAGDTAWTESATSGPALVGAPNTSSLGSITASALEGSTVDLTAELVALITTQRDFQANTKTIQTVDTMTQAVINLR